MDLSETLDKLCVACEQSRERLQKNISKAQGLVMRGVMQNTLTPEQSATVLRRLETLRRI